MRHKLLITLFALTFITFSTNQIEAKHHHHRRSHSNVKVHVSRNAIQPTYIVQPAPVVVQQPMVIHTTPVTTCSECYVTPTYVTPTYIVQQPVIVKQPRPRSFFNLGFLFRF
jgi:hypothetical protein